MASDKSSASRVRRFAKGAATLTVTTGFVLLAGGGVWTGSKLIAQRAAAVEAPPATDDILVSTRTISFVEAFEVERRFAGQIEAQQTASLSFEQGGTLESVMVDEGDQVKAGDVIAQLDDRLFKAEITRLKASRKALEAQLELAELTNERQSKLKKRGFATAQTADQTRISIIELNARIAEMDAAILAATIRAEKTTIRAPFDGRVNTRTFDPGNTVGGGQAVITLVENSPPVFRVGVAPKLATALRLGQTVNVVIGEQKRSAKLLAILPQIDPVTRARIVRAQLLKSNKNAFGQTGEIVLRETIAARGAWVPLSALEDGVRGLWTIKTVKAGTVGIEAAEIIHTDGKRAYIRGTFNEGISFIDRGVHRVAVGQSVKVAR